MSGWDSEAGPGFIVPGARPHPPVRRRAWHRWAAQGASLLWDTSHQSAVKETAMNMNQQPNGLSGVTVVQHSSEHGPCPCEVPVRAGRDRTVSDVTASPPPHPHPHPATPSPSPRHTLTHTPATPSPRAQHPHPHPATPSHRAQHTARLS